MARVAQFISGLASTPILGPFQKGLSRKVSGRPASAPRRESWVLVHPLSSVLGIHDCVSFISRAPINYSHTSAPVAAAMLLVVVVVVVVAVVVLVVLASTI